MKQEMNVFEDAEVVDQETGEIIKEENVAEENKSTADEIAGLFNDPQ